MEEINVHDPDDVPAANEHWTIDLAHRTGRPWADRSHDELSLLARELLLAGHLIDRSGMPHLIARFGRDAMRDVAISEWMAASPVYTRRMQRLFGFEGDTVSTIFKGIQFDIGAPHEFLDFRFVVHDDHHGEFTLDHCGALMDVEPMGEDYVEAMCHQIEDPTFDATAIATNPRARVRPVHRPPRVPSDRAPHCHWTVTIDEDRAPLPTPPESIELAACTAARLPLATPDISLPTDDGWNEYSGEFDPDLATEDLSSAALSALLDEVSLQGHLLTRAYLLQVADRTTPEEAQAIGVKQATGVAGVAAKRLAAALGAPPNLEGVARVLAVHPLLLPRAFVGVDFSATEDQIIVTLPPSPGRAEVDGLTWPSLLADGGDAILEAIATCVSPQAAIERLADAGDDCVRWSITFDPAAEPATQASEVTLTEFSTGATFAFHPRPPSEVAVQLRS